MASAIGGSLLKRVVSLQKVRRSGDNAGSIARNSRTSCGWESPSRCKQWRSHWSSTGYRVAFVATGNHYEPRRPEQSLLYQVIARELETFLALRRERDRDVPRFVEQEFRAFLDCGILPRGFLRLRCGHCGKDRALAFSPDGKKSIRGNDNSSDPRKCR